VILKIVTQIGIYKTILIEIQKHCTLFPCRFTAVRSIISSCCLLSNSKSRSRFSMFASAADLKTIQNKFTNVIRPLLFFWPIAPDADGN